MTNALTVAAVCLASALVFAQAPAPLRPDATIDCEQCVAWNAKREPFRVFGNTYYVGMAGLSSVLITSGQGHILLDGGLPQSAALIDASIRSLGFRTADIRLIVTSHEHFDHVGGVAALQRASGAMVASSSVGARALGQGLPTSGDPQGGGEAVSFPPVRGVRAVADGETLRVHDLAVTAHLTPGHTPGSTTWRWRSCEGPRCLNIVYADSLNAVSFAGFRFTQRPAAIDAFRRSIAKVQSLPCDILLTVHPDFMQLNTKIRLRAEGVKPDPFVNAKACQAYSATASRTLDRRIETEQSPAARSN